MKHLNQLPINAKLVAYVIIVAAAIISVIVLSLDYPPSSSSAKIVGLQSIPNSDLSDNHIIQQTDNIQSVKIFRASYPSAIAQVFRTSVVSAPISGNELEVLYSNAKNNALDGSVILHVLLSKQETGAQDALETHVIYECNHVLGVYPCK